MCNRIQKNNPLKADCFWFKIFLYLQVSHKSFVTRKLSSFLRLRNVLKKEIPEFIAIHILSKLYIDNAYTLFLQSYPKENRLSIIINDGKFFDRRIIIKTSVYVYPIFIHDYLGSFWSIILYHKIYSDENKDHNTKRIESDENPPNNEGKSKNPCGHIPTRTFCILCCDIPRKHNERG